MLRRRRSRSRSRSRSIPCHEKYLQHLIAVWREHGKDEEKIEKMIKRMKEQETGEGEGEGSGSGREDGVGETSDPDVQSSECSRHVVTIENDSGKKRHKSI